MSDNSPSPKPAEIGRRILRGLAIALLVVFILVIAIGVVEGVFGISIHRYVVAGIVTALGIVIVLLLVGPGLVFLIHSFTRGNDVISPRLRTSAVLSALAPGAAGVLMIGNDETLYVTVGWALIVVAAIVFVRAGIASKTDSNANARDLRYGYSFLGLVLSLLWMMANRPSPYHLTDMKSDLRNLVSAEESYFADHKRYTTNLSELGFKSSSGVTAPVVDVVPGGWHATTSHNQLKNVVCGIAVNTTNPVVATAGDGEPACK